MPSKNTVKNKANTSDITFSYWEKNGIERIYVNGIASPTDKLWIEDKGDHWELNGNIASSTNVRSYVYGSNSTKSYNLISDVIPNAHKMSFQQLKHNLPKPQSKTKKATKTDTRERDYKKIYNSLKKQMKQGLFTRAEFNSKLQSAYDAYDKANGIS